MSDNNIRGDEQYQYPDDEYVVESKPQSEQAKTETTAEVRPEKSEPMWKQFLRRNKRPVAVIGLVIIALIAFQIMNYNKNNKVVSKKKTVSTEVKATKPKVQTESATQAAVQNAMLQRSLAGIRSNSQSNASAISTVKDQLQGLQNQVTQVNQTNGQLKQAVVLLVQELKNVNQTLNTQAKVKKPSGPPSPKLVYTVSAIVSGRAWIKGSNGLDETVTVGDPIPGYGQVKSILPERGVIETSSGKIIKLGTNDY